MEATCVTHIGICVRDMDRSLAFYRDILGMTVLGDRMTDPTEGGRLHNYRRERQARHWVSLAYGDGATPTLTLTSHPGDDPDGQPIKLDEVGISHISFGVADVKALTQELLDKASNWPDPSSLSPTPTDKSAAYTSWTRTASSSSSTHRIRGNFSRDQAPAAGVPCLADESIRRTNYNQARPLCSLGYLTRLDFKRDLGNL